jgi:hypothetical protein
VSGPDSLSLAGNWNTVNGTIYGEGDSSKAVFSNATVNTYLDAFSCDTGAQYGTSSGIFTPTPCAASATNPVLNAVPSKDGLTGESNNLVNGDVSFQCEKSYECVMSYTSTTAD